MVKTYKSVGLSYNPNDLKFGHVNNLEYFFERRRNQVILQGALRLYQLQAAYARSLVETPSYTVLAFRDNLLSIALSLSLRCAQTKDVLYMEMTNHASTYWAKYGNTFWVEIPDYSSDPEYVPDTAFCGVAGSLAFLLHQNQDTGAGLYPHQLLQKMLDYLWEELDILSSLNPSEKVNTFLEKIGADHIPFDKYESALTSIASSNLNELSSELQTFVVQNIRRKLLTPNDWSRLKLRWLLKEVTPEVVSAITALQLIANQEEQVRQRFGLPISSLNLEEFDDTLLSLLPPAGTVLMFVGFAVEGLLKAIVSITETDELHSIAYQDFLGRSDYAEFRRSVAMNISTTYDALGALGVFNTLYEARGLAYRMYLTALQLIAGQTPISKTEFTRLNGFL